MPTYTWTIKRLITGNVNPDIDDYVVAVEWERTKSMVAGEELLYSVVVEDETSEYLLAPKTDITAKISMTTKLSLPDEITYVVEYNKLSESEVIEWVESSLPHERMQTIEHLLNEGLRAELNKARRAELQGMLNDRQLRPPPWEQQSVADPVVEGAAIEDNPEQTEG